MKIKIKMYRRLALVAFATAVMTVAGDMLAADEPKTKELVIVSWGGSYMEAQRNAYWGPWSEATGIEVIEDTGPQIERSRAEVETGSPSFDITSTNQAFYSIGLQQDLWIPINYDYFDPEDLKAMPEHVIKSHGVGTLYYAVGIAINKEEFKGDQPSSWADFWNVAKFPGKRSLPWCDAATYPLPEAALLADGVAIEDLYPVDIERAAKKLRDLSDHIIWWKKGNKPGQLLSTGEVSMAMAPNGRIQKLIDGGSPLHIVWNQGRYTFDVWYVLKGAANADNAMRFIAAASRPEAQARMARALAYGPTNPRALELLDEATLKKLPNHPDNAKKMFLKNEAWWIENRSKWIEACTEALL